MVRDSAPFSQLYQLMTIEGDIKHQILETEYEISRHVLEKAVLGERQRAQRVRQLLLEHENDELREEMACSHVEVEGLALEIQSLQTHFDTMRTRWEKSNGVAKARSREIECLKVL